MAEPRVAKVSGTIPFTRTRTANVGMTPDKPRPTTETTSGRSTEEANDG